MTVVSLLVAPPGSALPAKAGDFILVHHDTLIGSLIRFGQMFRYRGKLKPYRWANHAALVVSDDGDLIEATASGIRKNRLSEYTPKMYIIVDPGFIAEDRQEGVAFAAAMVGQRYGYLQIACIAIGLLTGSKLTFGYQGHMVCSGLVSRALERGTFISPRDPTDMAPADLAFAFQAVPG